MPSASPYMYTFNPFLLLIGHAENYILQCDFQLRNYLALDEAFKKVRAYFLHRSPYMISPRGSNLEQITAPSESSANGSQFALQALLSDTCSMRRAPRISPNDDDDDDILTTLESVKLP